ncbi:hypothetical protein PR048_009531, partial [Dryococelus australis]
MTSFSSFSFLVKSCHTVMFCTTNFIKGMSIASRHKKMFTFNDHLSVATLFQPDLFTQHRIVFPEAQFKTAVTLFNVKQNVLRQEVLVLYARNDFKNSSESVKLLRIICTIPMTSESERCFSTLKRIKTFTRNTMKEERLALAMCSIEKILLKRPNFNELVIDNFSEQKERRKDFVYK